MLDRSLELIRQELGHYFEQNGFDDTDVKLDNIAMFESDSGTSDMADKAIISLVNIEEERTLKNIPAYKTSPRTGRLEYSNPPVHLNLYVLFTATCTSQYTKSLRMLSLVVRFFQSKSVFTIQDSLLSMNDTNLSNLRLLFNIYTLTFEQLNHLWGSLGGKQMPHVLYRVWLVEEKDQKPIGSGDVITDIEGNLSGN